MTLGDVSYSDIFSFFSLQERPVADVANMLARAALSKGITAQRLCKNVTLYLNELTFPGEGVQRQTPGDQKPLLLMLPWLGSRPQAVAKYCEIYFRTGFDVLVVESEVRGEKWK